MALTQRVLDHGWTLSCDRPVGAPTLPQSIPASVPGTVHTDLLAARLIPDPYLDLNEIAVDWVGRCDWRYDLSFDWHDDGAANAELVFPGLDTFAQIVLNGAIIGETANMNRTNRLTVATIGNDKLLRDLAGHLPAPANMNEPSGAFALMARSSPNGPTGVFAPIASTSPRWPSPSMSRRPAIRAMNCSSPPCMTARHTGISTRISTSISPTPRPISA